jgi:hypothetical protein
LSHKRDYDIAHSLAFTVIITERVGVANMRAAIYSRADAEAIAQLEEWHFPPGLLESETLPKLAEYFSLWLCQSVEDVWGDALDSYAQISADTAEPLTLPMGDY